MSRHLSWVFLVLLVPSLGRAAEAPERVLSAEKQIYLRWDGLEAHQTAYDKAAVGQLFKGDLGRFLNSVVSDLKGNLGTWLTVPQLLEGATPAKLQQMQGDVTEAPKLLDIVLQHGFIVAGEFRGVVPPGGQVTLILPQAGAKPAPFLSAMRLIAALAAIPVKEEKVGDRTFQHFTDEGFHLVWWVEGPDAVLVVGTDTPKEIVARLTKAPRLAEQALYRRMQDFKEFETGTRAFIDLASLAQKLRPVHPNVGKVIDDLGLDGLKSVVFHSGFEGEVSRSVVLIDMPSPRKGLLKLADARPFKITDLPALPEDMTSFTATRFDLAGLFDGGVKVVEALLEAFEPDALPEFKAGLGQLDQLLGFSLRNDLLGSLGDLLVLYNSPAEGPLTFGQTLLLPVKDPKKVHSCLAQAAKALAGAAGAEVQVKKKTYHGADVFELHVKQQGFFFLPTYTIHKGWLAVSLYPQGVNGFILRANGELPTWKPDDRTQQALAKLPREVISMSYTDPRTGVKQILSLAPFIVSLINSYTKEIYVDVGSMPNAHEVSRHLFPNLSVVTGTNEMLRLESRASLGLPSDLAGIDGYSAFIIFFLIALDG